MKILILICALVILTLLLKSTAPKSVEKTPEIALKKGTNPMAGSGIRLDKMTGEQRRVVLDRYFQDHTRPDGIVMEDHGF